jgi:hypothetical protein
MLTGGVAKAQSEAHRVCGYILSTKATTQTRTRGFIPFNTVLVAAYFLRVRGQGWFSVAGNLLKGLYTYYIIPCEQLTHITRTNFGCFQKKTKKQILHATADQILQNRCLHFNVCYLIHSLSQPG